MLKRKRTRPAPGSRPGTITAATDAKTTSVTVLTYDGSQLDEKAELPTTFDAESHSVTWVNVCGLADVETLGRIGETFGVHTLALEDAVHTPQRPKIEELENRLFVVMQMLTEGAAREQLSLCLGPNFVVTFQEREGDPFGPVRNRLRNGRGRLRSAGADYLAYALIDAVIDSYMPILDDFEEGLELLEEELRTPTHSPVERIQRRRAELRELRRAVVPLRDVTRSLATGEWDQIRSETQTYLRDCHDHALEAVDQLDSCRELAAGLMDAHLSTVSTEVNQTTRILTVIATIFMPLSFLAGLYGMNFDPNLPGNMPELGIAYAYPVLLGFMALVGGALAYYFFRKGWF